MPARRPPPRPARSFNPSPVCGTGEIGVEILIGSRVSFQSVSGLWDRRNTGRQTTDMRIEGFQSVSGLWDRRNFLAGVIVPSDSGFNPSPVCGTGEMPACRRRRARTAGFNPSPVCGTGEISNLPSLIASLSFQSVSGLWDRRNRNPGRRSPRRERFNPSPVCGTGEMPQLRAEDTAGGRYRQGVSIRLRSVGPEKSAVHDQLDHQDLFQSVSGLWDRRNRGHSRPPRRRVVSIRLRSVGPEKLQDRIPGFGERKVSIRLRSVGPEKFGLHVLGPPLAWFQSVSGLWDRRNGTGLFALVRDSVSIRLRSVGPEKCPRPPGSPTPWPFQSVSGLWDRRNDGGKGEIRRPAVSIRLRSVGPEKFQPGTNLIRPRRVSIRLRSVGPEKCRPACWGRARAGFNPSPVCGTGEMRNPSAILLVLLFQSVSGLWDRRNGWPLSWAGGGKVSIRLRSVGPEKSAGLTLADVSLMFQSVSGLWDRRNSVMVPGGAYLVMFQSVSGLWDRRNAPSPPSESVRKPFQSVSGLWDRRNAGNRSILRGGCAFQSVSGLWDRRNPVRRRQRCRIVVSIRLRSVGPEK